MDPVNHGVELAKRIGLLLVGGLIGVFVARAFKSNVRAIEGIGLTLFMAAGQVFRIYLDAKKGRVTGEKPRFTAKFRPLKNSFQTGWDMGLFGLATGVAGIVTGFVLEGRCRWEWIILIGMSGAGMAAATWFSDHTIRSAKP